MASSVFLELSIIIVIAAITTGIIRLLSSLYIEHIMQKQDLAATASDLTLAAAYGRGALKHHHPVLTQRYDKMT